MRIFTVVRYFSRFKKAKCPVNNGSLWQVREHFVWSKETEQQQHITYENAQSLHLTITQTLKPKTQLRKYVSHEFKEITVFALRRPLQRNTRVTCVLYMV